VPSRAEVERQEQVVARSRWAETSD
jgi:hypothetical protein